MKGTEKEAYVFSVFEKVSEGYDEANDRISLGLQKQWKKMLTDRLADSLPSGSGMLDVCCGTGDIAIAAAKGRPDVSVTGMDFSPAMLKIAGEKGKGIPNLHWERADAMHLPWEDNSFSAVTISFGLRNTPDYEQVIAEMYRVLRPGGYMYCLDSFVPDIPVVLPFYRLYFKWIMPHRRRDPAQKGIQLAVVIHQKLSSSERACEDVSKNRPCESRTEKQDVRGLYTGLGA
jgi:demethylmenaquinone methyltransferase/2-methoxy-6-polyprenyl-1,4-benzoquinol methylase